MDQGSSKFFLSQSLPTTCTTAVDCRYKVGGGGALIEVGETRQNPTAAVNVAKEASGSRDAGRSSALTERDRAAN